MIIDSLAYCDEYISINKNFEKAFNFIKKALKENYNIGRYEIDGSDIYAFIQEYSTNDETECKYEGHKKYIDIQFIASGSEVMKAMNISNAAFNTEYNTERDIQFYNDSASASTAIINENEFAIFFPHDIHKPGIATNGNKTPVKKIVVKVLNDI